MEIPSSNATPIKQTSQLEATSRRKEAKPETSQSKEERKDYGLHKIQNGGDKTPSGARANAAWI